MAEISVRAVFLSAGVPDPKREAATWPASDVLAIRECVLALAVTVLPTAQLVFGGHPAITPMLYNIGRRLGHLDNVRLFQSAFFAGHWPEETLAFAPNLRVVPAVGKSQERSLRRMRLEMIQGSPFSAGVFVAGMEGVEREFQLFKRIHPRAAILPMASTGGASRGLFDKLAFARRDERFLSSRVYAAIFEELIGPLLGRERTPR